jgi:hypothetical protein
MRIGAALGALYRQGLLAEFAAQAQTDLTDELLPALDDLDGAPVTLAKSLRVDTVSYGHPGRTHVLKSVAAGILVLKVVQQFLQEPRMGGVADALVADQHLCLVGHFGPGQVPQRDLVLTPSVDPDVHQRTAFQGHVV